MKLNKVKTLTLALVLLANSIAFADESFGVIYGDKFNNKEVKSYLLDELHNSYPQEKVTLVESNNSSINHLTTFEQYEELAGNKNLDGIIYLDFLSTDILDKLNKNIVIAPFYYGKDDSSNSILTKVIYDKKSIIKTLEDLKITDNLVIISDENNYNYAKHEATEYSSVLKKQIKVIKLSQLDNLDLDNISGAIILGDEKIFSEDKNIEKIKDIPLFSYHIDTKENNLNILIGYDYEKEIQRRIRANIIALKKYTDDKNTQINDVSLSNNENLYFDSNIAKKLNKYPSTNEKDSMNITQLDEISDKTSLSLQDGLQMVLSKNISLEINKKKLDSQKSQISIAKSGAKPKVDLVGGYNRVDKVSATMNPTIAQNTVTGGVKLSQVLYNANTFGNISLEKKSYTAQQINNRNSEINIVLGYINSYFNVLKSSSNVRILEENTKVISEFLKIAKSKNNAGSTGPADVYRFQSELASAESALTDAKIQEENTALELNRILNSSTDEDYELNDDNIDNILDTTSFYDTDNNISKPWEIKDLRTKYINQALDNSPQIKALEAQQKVEEQRYKNISRSRYTPTVSLNANYNKDLVDPWGTGSQGVHKGENWRIGVGFDIPLYDGGSISSYKSQSQNRIDEFKLQIEDTKKTVEREVSTGFNNVLGSLKKMKLANSALEASQKNLDLQVNLYKRGQGNIINVLDARNSFIKAKENIVDTKISFYTSLAKLESVSGKYHYELSTIN